MKRNVSTLCLVSAIVYGAACTAQAALVVNIDFGPTGSSYTGTAAAPDSGTTWNAYGWAKDNWQSGYKASSLKDSGGATTGVSFQEVGSCTPTNHWNGIGSYDGLMKNSLTGGGSFSSYGRIGGLTVGQTYDVYAYAASHRQDWDTTLGNGSFRIGSVVKSTTGSNQGRSSLAEGRDYVFFHAVSPDVGGNIDLYFGPTNQKITGGAQNQTSWMINGLQLVQVPEPASLGLLASMGGLGLLARRRRA